MTKRELREEYKAKRKGLSSEDIEKKSMAIANQCLGLSIWEGSIYHVFLSIEQQKEVSTEPLLSVLQGKDKNIAVSKSDFSTFKMTHYLLTDSTVFKTNKWGIPEPEGGIEIRSEQIDVIFLPLLAFDTKGNRIGYGKGFYDRFLESCRKDSIKIGLSFYKAEDAPIEPSETDIPLDFCVTPKRVYAF